MGLLFRFASQSGQEPSSLEGPQQILGVYTTDPYATVHLNVQVFWKGRASGAILVPDDDVDISVSGPLVTSATRVMITSSLPEPADFQASLFPFRKLAVIPGETGLTVESPGYIQEVSVRDVTSVIGAPIGVLVGLFNLPGAVAESHGSYFAHLPTVGSGENEFGPSFPQFLTETDPAGVENLIEDPQPKDGATLVGASTQDPWLYTSSGHPENLYWQPEVLDSSETLTGAEPLFTNTNVNVQPSNGVLEGTDYTWQETGNIDPMITSIEDGAAASQNAWTFRSGIAFGIAAGAGIGFIQEKENPIFTGIARLYRSFRRMLRKRPRPEAA